MMYSSWARSFGGGGGGGSSLMPGGSSGGSFSTSNPAMIAVVLAAYGAGSSADAIVDGLNEISNSGFTFVATGDYGLQYAVTVSGNLIIASVSQSKEIYHPKKGGITIGKTAAIAVITFIEGKEYPSKTSVFFKPRKRHLKRKPLQNVIHIIFFTISKKKHYSL